MVCGADVGMECVFSRVAASVASAKRASERIDKENATSQPEHRPCGDNPPDTSFADNFCITPDHFHSYCDVCSINCSIHVHVV